MATTVLTYAGGAIGAAIGGPVGWYVGAAAGMAAGSWIDNRFLMPALSPAIKGQRLEDMAPQAGSEGSVINFCIGEIRVPGVIIWCTDKMEDKHKEGGKGGQKQTTYTYSVHMAVAICEGEIQSIKKIYANGNLIYNSEPDNRLIESDEISVSDVFWGKFLTTPTLTISSPIGGPDLSEIQSGIVINGGEKGATISGFANSGNNGTFFCQKSWKNIDGSSGARMEGRIGDLPQIEAAGNNITIAQTFSDVVLGAYNSMEIYTGDELQAADALIDSLEPENTVPGYRGVAYVVFTHLQLNRFGNMIPNLEFVVEKDTDPTVAEGIEAIMDRADVSDYDTSGLSGDIDGYAVSSLSTSLNILLPLLTAYDIVMTEMNGIMYFTHRGDADTVVIAEADLACGTENASVDFPFTFSDKSARELPSEASLKYTDIDNDYQTGEQKENLVNYYMVNIRNYSLPLALNGAAARDIVKRLLWTAYANRRTITLFLPMKYMQITENDYIEITYNSETYTVFVTKIARGNNYLLRIEGLVEEPQTLVQTSTGSSNPDSGQTIYVSPMVVLRLIDIAALAEAQLLVAGYYYAMEQPDDSVAYRGSSIFDSLDDSIFEEVSNVPNIILAGVTTSVLADTHTARIWDRGNSVTVQVSGELENRTEEAVMNGANTALIGDEIIGYTTVTLVETGVYTLSGLLRGLRNTENAMATHETGEPFILLSEGAVYFEPIDTYQVGATKYFKGVPVGVDSAEIDSFSHEFLGGTIKPFSPAHFEGVRNPSDDIVLTWVRRSRDFSRLFGPQLEVSDLETIEKYEVDIFDGVDLKRTLTVTDATTVTYDRADQITDGFAADESIKMRIYQISEQIGRGNYNEENLG